MMLILAVYGVVRVIGKTIKNVPSGQKQTEQPAESETQTETEDTTRINLTLNLPETVFWEQMSSLPGIPVSMLTMRQTVRNIS